MRRILIELTTTIRAEDTAAAAAQVRAALAGLRTFGLAIGTADLGPVEEAPLAPENVRQVQGTL